ncbi:MAG: LapA family protein [Rubripirellula sp.]
MQKIRWILLILAIPMALAVTFQNNDAVPVRLLWIERNMPLSILVASTTAIGFLAGALTTALMLVRRSPTKRDAEKNGVNHPTKPNRNTLP